MKTKFQSLCAKRECKNEKQDLLKQEDRIRETKEDMLDKKICYELLGERT